MARREILLADADVLIDYRDSDLKILCLVAEHVGPVRVLREILAEAVGITERKCLQLNIEIVDLETELMMKVNTLPASISVNDRLCVVACEHSDGPASPTTVHFGRYARNTGCPCVGALDS